MAAVDDLSEPKDSFNLKLKEKLTESSSSALSSKVILDMIRVSDFMIVFLTAILAKYIYIDLYIQTTEITYSYKYLSPAFMCAVFFYILSRRIRLYRDFVFGGFHIQAGRVLYCLVTAFSIVLFIGFMLKVAEGYSRGWFLVWFVIAFGCIFFERLIIRAVLGHCISKGMFTRKVAIIASNSFAGSELKERLLDQKIGVEVVGLFDDNMQEAGEDKYTLEQLIELGQKNKIDQVIISMPTSEEHRISRIFNRLRVLPVDIQLAPTRQSSVVPLLKVQQLGDVDLLLVHRKPIEGWSYLQKVFEDYIIGILALIAFAPIMLLVAIAIKLDSKGPVFFRQRRHGYNHKLIEVLKFRTMTVMEDGDVIKQAQKDDARVTRVGKFLRKSSLDELPQLFNVLKGEMSLVGPRPHAMAHNHYYSEMIERYANRHRVKPGITGWAQVNGYRGPTSDPEDMKKRAELDLHYIDNWSLWFDIKIIAVTPLYGFIGKNAF